MEITLPRSLDSLEPIRKFVAEAAAAAGLDKMRTHRLCLAVDEVASNSVLYGTRDNDGSGSIELKAIFEGGGVKIVLEDDCAPFDPTAQPQTDLDLPFEERDSGGLGLHLAVHGVDGFYYQRINDLNRTIFVISEKPGAHVPP